MKQVRYLPRYGETHLDAATALKARSPWHLCWLAITTQKRAVLQIMSFGALGVIAMIGASFALSRLVKTIALQLGSENPVWNDLGLFLCVFLTLNLVNFLFYIEITKRQVEMAEMREGVGHALAGFSVRRQRRDLEGRMRRNQPHQLRAGVAACSQNCRFNHGLAPNRPAVSCVQGGCSRWRRGEARRSMVSRRNYCPIPSHWKIRICGWSMGGLRRCRGSGLIQPGNILTGATSRPG